MDALPKLELIGCYGVGGDAIDLAHAARRNIIVTNTPDVLNDDVANMAIALLLATSREICNGDRYVRAGKCLQQRMPSTRAIRCRRLGSLCLGRISWETARHSHVFDSEVSYLGRSQHDVPSPLYAGLYYMALLSTTL